MTANSQEIEKIRMDVTVELQHLFGSTSHSDLEQQARLAALSRDIKRQNTVVDQKLEHLEDSALNAASVEQVRAMLENLNKQGGPLKEVSNQLRVFHDWKDDFVPETKLSLSMCFDQIKKHADLISKLRGVTGIESMSPMSPVVPRIPLSELNADNDTCSVASDDSDEWPSASPTAPRTRLPPHQQEGVG